jgi:hypothetical protein
VPTEEYRVVLVHRQRVCARDRVLPPRSCPACLRDPTKLDEHQDGHSCCSWHLAQDAAAREPRVVDSFDASAVVDNFEEAHLDLVVAAAWRQAGDLVVSSREESCADCIDLEEEQMEAPTKVGNAAGAYHCGMAAAERSSAGWRAACFVDTAG